MITFPHKPLYMPNENDRLTEEYIDGKRFYKTTDGCLYPSVTTVLSIVKEDVLKAWQLRVGEEEANKIKTSAAVRGTIIHEQAEDYLKGQYDSKKYPAIHRMMFNQLRTYIDEVEIVHNIEVPLYSNYLQLAGRCDLVAKWRGKRTIIDFKTSRRVKKRDEILNYFMQAAAYAIMYEERSGYPVKNLAIFIAVDNESPQLFVEDRDEWSQLLLHYRREYDRRYGLPNQSIS